MLNAKLASLEQKYQAASIFMLLYRRPLNIKIVALFVITMTLCLIGCGNGGVTGVDENGAYEYGRGCVDATTS